MLHTKLNTESYSVLIETLHDAIKRKDPTLEIEWSVHNPTISSRICYGTDEEAALLKAITSRHPEALIRICVDHLFENFVRSARKYNIGKAEYTRMWEYLTRITATKSETFYQRSIQRLQEVWIDRLGETSQCSGSPHRQAFGRKVLKYAHKLNIHHRRPYLDALRSKDYSFPYSLDLHFSNNNAESINASIKRETRNCPTSTPKLIQIIKSKMERQRQDVFRVFSGAGHYNLSTGQERLFIGRTRWEKMPDEDKEKAVLALMKGDKKLPGSLMKSPRKQQVVTSKTGKTTVVVAPGDKHKKKPSLTSYGHTRPRTMPGRKPL